jgi:uncharacterized protein YdaU (DUF1376 family)
VDELVDDALPEPPVPAEVDLRGLEYMPLLGARLFGSEFALEATDAEFRAGLRLWWAAWQQQPAASLPRTDRSLCKLAGLGEDLAKWRKVRKRALHGFVLCSDDRLYHDVLAQQALIAWEKRAEDRAERDNVAERKRRERAERKRMFAELRAVNIVPDFNIKQADLRQLVTEHVTRTVPGDVTGPVTSQVTSPVTRTVTAKTGRDGTGHRTSTADLVAGVRDTGDSDDDLSDPPEPPALPDPPPPPPPPPPTPTPAPGPATPYGAIARRLRDAGIQASPSSQRFRVLVDAGADADEFLALVPKALAVHGDQFAYLVGAVEGERKRAATTAGQLHRGQMQPVETAHQRQTRERVAEFAPGAAAKAPRATSGEVIDVPARRID